MPGNSGTQQAKRARFGVISMNNQHQRKGTETVRIPYARVEGQLIFVKLPARPALPAVEILEEVRPVHGVGLDGHRRSVFGLPNVGAGSVEKLFRAVWAGFGRVLGRQPGGHCIGGGTPRNDVVHRALVRTEPDQVDVGSHREQAQGHCDDFLADRRAGESARNKGGDGRARKPSTTPAAIAIGTPSWGGKNTSITTTQAPTIHPVAMRGSLRAMVSSSATTAAVREISTAANAMANAKSNA